MNKNFIDMNDEVRALEYRHEHKALKSLDRYIRKWLKRKAPKEGIIFINANIMNKILKGA